MMLVGWKRELRLIPGAEDFEIVRPVSGMSLGSKYYVKSRTRGDILLILGTALDQDMFKKETLWIKYLEDQGVLTNRVLDGGIYNAGQGYYLILSWIPGVDVQKELHKKASNIASQLGMKSGQLLKGIHNVPLMHEETQGIALSDMIFDCIERYSDNTLLRKYPSMETFLRFLKDNKNYKPENSCPTLLHGDYHAKNIVYSGGAVFAIDWIYGKVGNPIEDFVRNIISAETSPYYASALIDEYYNNYIPDGFWMTLAIYTAIHELYITKYSFKKTFRNISFVDYQHSLVLKQYDRMKQIIPAYYMK